jgi:Na+/H+ antiporter NhaC
MSTGILLWIISLVIGLVVIGVVAFLLHLVKSTALKIDGVAADIWTHGKLTANNTIHIPLFLTKTNAVVSSILKSAVMIVTGSKAIQQHIEGCPGCPACILQNSKTQKL